MRSSARSRRTETVQRTSWASVRTSNASACVSILLSSNRSRVLMTQTAAELDVGDGFAIAHDVRRGSS
jgi:hypothetical protein